MTEADVAKVTGCPRKTLRGFRPQLTEGTDWAWVSGTVTYTQEGLKKVAAFLGCQDMDLVPIEAPAPTSVTDDPEKEAAAIEMDLRVERVCPNPTWVQARKGKELVTVRVKDNRWMKRGTLLKGVVADPQRPGRFWWSGRKRW